VTVAALVGSGVMTALLFTPVMEWVGSNSSALDMFILGGTESGLRFAALCWRDILWPTLLVAVVVWGPVHRGLVKARRAGAVSVLMAGAALGMTAGLAMYGRLVFSFLNAAREVKAPWLTSPDFADRFIIPHLWFGLHAAVVGAGIGVVMAGVFRFVAGSGAR
jgi:hypothetical protein